MDEIVLLVTRLIAGGIALALFLIGFLAELKSDKYKGMESKAKRQNMLGASNNYNALAKRFRMTARWAMYSGWTFLGLELLLLLFPILWR
ncbi:hypothetical protein A3K34_04095 [candidate division WWE3 bacterium RIFOXYC1_FULL_40_10]|uniref:Uncharacterized protein n=1 Tax=candidate division WWE3 bacterium RIFOXYA2_FULL_46_9 TaxID=1802636 RepID=A0A1F4W0I9_UNCKA|nr:MAG: hypothetical protein A3K58_04095 [candidate division WWE3 bacterium RIFOXYB1_FULL_40_22]OGC62022.1 MAG: hypothetical protein A3K37_04095 [candidate division WWE3 bacterium RIFOXYA1_FULL_40_11]OGC62939.1 MAG: hypothetical protein A2264_03610 [candidate division WWE3 bacterium RIFOXYA2_FULL_46_9]OGC65034.1 MAG: hypothetical protein A2326_03275 [candidate division WWE3 bacterium RIFOXYB2_FULL_41_6]OGC66405.1 MAG: hypothetical protein A3K34_04095 [candidate division WWE3 bacterium RIFOXYC1_